MLAHTEIFTWGANRKEQLSTGTDLLGTNYDTPRFCTFNVFISQVACGEGHSAFISNSGNVYTMGSNADGRLRIGDKQLQWSPSRCLVDSLLKKAVSSLAVGTAHSAVVSDTGSLHVWGEALRGV